jgi:hypothetical protein
MKVSRRTAVSCQAWSYVAWLGVLVTTIGAGDALGAEVLPNACLVDGCEVKILGVKPAGEELELTFESNFSPDVSKNHFHVWWGEKFTVEQVGRNAETVHGVTQGRWHRHDDYPTYVTTGAASTSVREGAATVCVSPADRNHNIIDVKIYNCVEVSSYL